MARLLLAIDMDGTLLRDDKTIAGEDVDAIRLAASRDIAVTLSTGRLTTGALPTARELGLSTPLICADGSVLVDVSTGAYLEQRSIRREHAERAVLTLFEHGLTPYVFMADAIHCEEAGERQRAFVDTWTREMVVHASLAGASLWQQPEGVAVTLGIGDQGSVARASEHLSARHGDELDTVHFTLGGSSVWGVRSLRRGCDKGQMLASLARRMALPRERVAVVGDWLNDLGMFEYAGRSFAMGHAPPVVRAAATHVLSATSHAGGGVAEAITALLST